MISAGTFALLTAWGTLTRMDLVTFPRRCCRDP